LIQNVPVVPMGNVNLALMASSGMEVVVRNVETFVNNALEFPSAGSVAWASLLKKGSV
jgi:hypothetical protein